MLQNSKYNIITLCGSIKFKTEFMKVQDELVLKGNIVLTPNFFSNINVEINRENKKMLDKMHRQKIDISDEIFIINVGGYIGEVQNLKSNMQKKRGKRFHI